MHVAFASTAVQRAQRWEDLLRRLFRPLHVDRTLEPVESARIGNDGLELLLPAVADVPSLKLSYPQSGRALFSPRNRETAGQLVTFIAQAESSREAYDRGVSEERLRMAQDLHDDLGARLLSGLHAADEKARPAFAAALDEMRMIVSELAREEARLNALLADARFEAQRRLSAVGIALEWSIDEDRGILLSYQEQKAVRSSLREAVNNVIHHSGATRMTISVKVEAGLLVLSTQDDGRGFSLELVDRADGYGLKSLRRRMLNLGGQIDFDPRPGACALRIQIPLRHS
jgi:signal transduction histidine kinase